MKTILCTTDFSRPSSKVCRYAAQLARQIGAKLVLLHATQPSFVYTPDMGALAFNDNALLKHEETKMKALARRLVKLVEGEILIETLVYEGFVADVIKQTALQIKPDMLVMSTVGQLPQSSELLGNIATEMIQKSPVPLLFIPPKATFKPYTHVYLALDLAQETNTHAIQQTLNTLKAFKAVITIFSVHPKPESEEAKLKVWQLRELLKEYPHVMNVMKGKDFVEDFVRNAHEYKADLMLVFPKHHNLLERWFMGQPNTEQLMFRADLPIMAIH
ncbi:universal stress protein [Emticicia sp. 17c]|uniref:universal stress protein n=1 Tax=Emticicia sp. 17c TaxID=3127704 RepID=UPI00301DB5DD